MTKNSFFFNGCFDKSRIKFLISWSLQNCGEQITIDLVENLKNIGFAYATQAGVSLGIDDLKIPPTKAELISTSDTKIQVAQINYKQGYLTGIEKFQQLIDTWHRTSETLKQNVIHYFKVTDILNPVYMMAFSGARGNISQVRQLVGMRGLMSDPQGQILDFPIKSNFREGLTLTEYVISCYGARKGLVDTALKTANSGYLTRRLVDVSHHIIVCEFDCKTKRGVIVNNIIENQKIIVPLQNRLIGRILAENIYSSTNNLTTNFSNNKTTYKTKKKLLFTPWQGPVPAKYSTSNELYTQSYKKKIGIQQNSMLRKMVFVNKSSFNFDKDYFKKIKNNARIFALFIDLSSLYFLNKSQNWVWNKTQQDYFSTNFIKIEISKKIDFYAKLQLNTNFPFYQLILFLIHVNFSYTKRKLVALKNQEISLSLSVKIANLKSEVLVRSPLTCEIKNSICQLCYGWSLAHGKLVSLGEAVGILAAQSIGEPGTQLTMRTFHTGGVFSGDIMSEIRAPFDGIIKFYESFQGMLIRTPHGKIAFLTKVPGKFDLYPKQTIDSSFSLKSEKVKMSINDKFQYNKIKNKNQKKITFEIPALTILFIRNHQYVSKTQIIAEFSSMSANRDQRIQANYDLNTEIEGEVFFKNVVVHVRKKKQKVISRTTNNLGNIWVLSGKISKQPIPIEIFPQAGDLVDQTSLIGQYQTMSPYNGFITIVSKKSAINSINKSRRKDNSQISWKYENFNNKTPVSNSTKLNLIAPTQVVSLSKNSLKKKNFQKTNVSNDKIFLNHTIISLPIKSIQYKEIGYFFSFYHFKKSKLSLDSFFLSNSLQQEFQSSSKLQTTFYFQSYPKQYQTQTGGILICDNFYYNEKLHCGEIFWVLEENYIFDFQDIIFFKKKYGKHTKIINSNLSVFTENKIKYQKKYIKWINKNNSAIYYYNSQGKFSSFYPKVYGCIEINTTDLFFSNFSKKTQNTSLVKLTTNHLNVSTPLFSIYKFDILGFRINPTISIFSLLKTGSNSTKKPFFINKYDAKPNKLYSYIWQSIKKNKKVNSKLLKKNHLSMLQPQFPWLVKTKFNSLQSLLNTLFLTEIKPSTNVFQLNVAASKKQQKNKSESKYKKSIQFYILNKTKIKQKNILSTKPYTISLNKPYAISLRKKPSILNFDSLTNKLTNVLQQPLIVGKKKTSFFTSTGKPLLTKTNLTSNHLLVDKMVYKKPFDLQVDGRFLYTKTLGYQKIDDKKKIINIKIKPGWVYFPRNIKQVIQKHKSIIKPGLNGCDNILFDQYPVYIECSILEKIFVQNKKNILEKNNNLKKILNIDYIYLEFFIDKNTENQNFSNELIKNNFFNDSRFAKTFSEILDKLLLNISTPFFKKNFTFLLAEQAFASKDPSLLNTRTQSNLSDVMYKKLILEKYIQKTKFQNFSWLREKKIYNYEKIYFIENKLKTKNHNQLQLYVKLKNSLSFKLKNFSSKNNLNVSPIFNRSLFIPKFFILIRKTRPYSFIRSAHYKKLLSKQNTPTFYSFISPNKFNSKLMTFSQSLNFNKQNITHLFFNSPAADFSIKPYFKHKESKKSIFYKTITIFQFCILFIIPENYPINTTKIQLISKPTVTILKPEVLQLLSAAQTDNTSDNLYLLVKQKNKLNFNSISYFNVSLFRELQFTNFVSQFFRNKITKLTHNTLLLSSQNSISNQIPVSLTKFFSPYQGEILKTQIDPSKTKIQIDPTKMQNYLILTNEDQTSFSTANLFTNKMLLLKIFLGKFIHYGTRIHENLVIPQSGRIIQIEKSKITLRKAQPILFSSKGLLSVHHGDMIEKNALVLRLFYQRLKTGDIVQGIPKIEQLFEARKTNQGEILAGSLHEELEWLFLFYRKKYDPQQAARRSLEKIQQIIVNNVQKVYQSQGVTIAEKHLEIIVRQMTSKVQIITSGETNLIPGELIDLDWIEIVNQGIKFKKKKAKYKPIILGITKKSLETQSFISEASFQETTRILAKSAIERKTDFLKGLKENVILGHVIPAGTGFAGKVFDSSKPKYFSISNYESYAIFRKIFQEAISKNSTTKTP